MDECLACALNEVPKGTHASDTYSFAYLTNLDFLDGHSDKCPFAALGRVITQTEYQGWPDKISNSVNRL